MTISASEQAGTEMEDTIMATYLKYGLAPTHLALLSLIDELHELDSVNRESMI